MCGLSKGGLQGFCSLFSLIQRCTRDVLIPLLLLSLSLIAVPQFLLSLSFCTLWSINTEQFTEVNAAYLLLKLSESKIGSISRLASTSSGHVVLGSALPVEASVWNESHFHLLLVAMLWLVLIMLRSWGSISSSHKSLTRCWSRQSIKNTLAWRCFLFLLLSLVRDLPRHQPIVHVFIRFDKAKVWSRVYCSAISCLHKRIWLLVRHKVLAHDSRSLDWWQDTHALFTSSSDRIRSFYLGSLSVGLLPFLHAACFHKEIADVSVWLTLRALLLWQPFLRHDIYISTCLYAVANSQRRHPTCSVSLEVQWLLHILIVPCCYLMRSTCTRTTVRGVVPLLCQMLWVHGLESTFVFIGAVECWQLVRLHEFFLSFTWESIKLGG